jgi:phospholipid transport system substrate-binding protein
MRLENVDQIKLIKVPFCKFMIINFLGGKMKIGLTVTVVFGFLLGTALCVYAATALETIKAPIDQIVTILKDPQYRDDAKKDEQEAKLWPIIHQIFDFTEVSKRALARNWRKFTPEQRKAFTNAFTDLLGNSYLDKMQGGEYKNVSVVFFDEKKLSEVKSQVRSKIISRDQELPVSYNLKLKKTGWRIYDVKVEGVSLIKNYRLQFNRNLKTNSPDELIWQIEKKVAQRDKQ